MRVKEFLLTIIKWGLVLFVIGMIFYWFYPKYYFGYTKDLVIIRGNKITGKVEVGTTVLPWREVGEGAKLSPQSRKERKEE